jgi:hypothetical protein
MLVFIIANLFSWYIYNIPSTSLISYLGKERSLDVMNRFQYEKLLFKYTLLNKVNIYHKSKKK